MTVKIRRTLFAAVLVLLSAVAMWVLWLRYFPNPRNFPLVTIGMTEEEVRARLGSSKVGLIMLRRQASGFHRLYANEAWEVEVYFDPNGRVEAVEARKASLFRW